MLGCAKRQILEKYRFGKISVSDKYEIGHPDHQSITRFLCHGANQLTQRSSQGHCKIRLAKPVNSMPSSA